MKSLGAVIRDDVAFTLHYMTSIGAWERRSYSFLYCVCCLTLVQSLLQPLFAILCLQASVHRRRV